MMAAVTEKIPYDCIFAQFPDGNSWGFVRRSNGDWSWRSMRDIQHTPDQVPPMELFDKTLKPIFMDTPPEEKSRPVDEGRKVKIIYSLFEKMFPQHPETLESFKLAGAKVDAQFSKALRDESSSDEEPSRWSTFD